MAKKPAKDCPKCRGTGEVEYFYGSFKSRVPCPCTWDDTCFICGAKGVEEDHVICSRCEERRKEEFDNATHGDRKEKRAKRRRRW